LIIQEIENSIIHAQSNVYTPLILTVLGIRIKEYLKRGPVKTE
jgi:hypothetical protein